MTDNSNLAPLISSHLATHQNPVTHSLTGMRGALLLGKSTSELAPEILWLSAAALVLIPASLGFFSRVLGRGRREGTLSAY